MESAGRHRLSVDDDVDGVLAGAGDACRVDGERKRGCQRDLLARAERDPLELEHLAAAWPRALTKCTATSTSSDCGLCDVLAAVEQLQRRQPGARLRDERASIERG